MDVEFSPTRKIKIMALDKRSLKNLGWCAGTYGMNRLCWINGYLLCLEVYEKSFDHEIKHKEFPVSQICYSESPRYDKILEIDKSFQIPIVDVSDMKLFQAILKTILEYEKTQKTTP